MLGARLRGYLGQLPGPISTIQVESKPSASNCRRNLDTTWARAASPSSVHKGQVGAFRSQNLGSYVFSAFKFSHSSKASSPWTMSLYLQQPQLPLFAPLARKCARAAAGLAA